MSRGRLDVRERTPSAYGGRAVRIEENEGGVNDAARDGLDEAAHLPRQAPDERRHCERGGPGAIGP